MKRIKAVQPRGSHSLDPLTTYLNSKEKRKDKRGQTWKDSVMVPQSMCVFLGDIHRGWSFEKTEAANNAKGTCREVGVGGGRRGAIGLWGVVRGEPWVCTKTVGIQNDTAGYLRGLSGGSGIEHHLQSPIAINNV